MNQRALEKKPGFKRTGDPPDGVTGPHRAVYQKIMRGMLTDGERNHPAMIDRTSLHVGLETRTPADRYYWDGTKRGVDPAHPTLLVQYTLGGRGAWEQGGATTDLRPGSAFFAVIPSDHRYFLPPASDNWTFIWLITRHPYVVSRVARRQRSAGAVLGIPPESVLLASIVRLIDDTARDAFRDLFARELALLDFMIEYDRFTHRQLYPQAKRQSMLDEVRAFVLRHLSNPPAVNVLAERHQMSRSHFSHHFKTVTGLSPARFITDVRLQEVARRLGQSNDTLKAIASDTGFADANHLCKVFRRFYHVSPGAFRKQIR